MYGFRYIIMCQLTQCKCTTGTRKVLQYTSTLYCTVLVLRCTTHRRYTVLYYAPEVLYTALMAYEGDDVGLIRPCVDCGRRTGSWCDAGTQDSVCLARACEPGEAWGNTQGTPLCTSCDSRHGKCHYCRGVAGCRPFAWGHPGGGTPAGGYRV